MNLSGSKLVRAFLALVLASQAASVLAVPSIEELLIYNNARLEAERTEQDSLHQVVLSAPTRINNAPFIELDERVTGEKEVMLLKLSDTSSASDAFTYYRALIEKYGKLIYSCEKRACGISSYWANSVFDERRLAGRDSDQYYVAGKIEIGGAHYWLNVYMVTNALRQNLAQVSLIRQEGPSLVWENGYLVLEDGVPPAPVIATLQEKMADGVGHVLYVVGYSKPTADAGLSAQEARLRSAFQNLSKKLGAALSVPPERLKFHFVGPLHVEAPSERTNWFRLFLQKP